MWQYIISQLPGDQYPEESNDEVVLHYRRGECLFDQVLLRYHRTVMDTALKKGVRGLDGDDLFQEYAIKLNKACSSWDPDGGTSFNTYLVSTLTNHWKYLLRRAMTTAQRASFEENLSLDETDEDGNPLIDIPYEEKRSIYEVLDGYEFTQQERRYIDYVLDGMNKAEIAKREGISRARVCTVMRDLGRRLEQLGRDLRS